MIDSPVDGCLVAWLFNKLSLLAWVDYWCQVNTFCCGLSMVYCVVVVVLMPVDAKFVW